MKMLVMILVGTLIFVDIIMAFSLGLAATPHKNVILENTLPSEALHTPEVKALTKRYRTRLWQIALIFSMLNFTMFFTHYESFLMTLFWVLLLIPMGAFYGTEIFYIRQMAQLKVNKGWQLPVTPVLVDTKLTLTKNKKMLHFGYLIPALLLSLGLAWFMLRSQNDGAAILSISLVIGWFIAFACWYGVKRLPVAAPTNVEKLNRQYNDLTKHDWAIVAVGTAYGILFALGLPFFASQLTGIWAQVTIWLMLILIVGFSFLLVWYLIRVRKKQDALLNQVTDYRYQGEDQYWRFGVYINPDDHRLMLPDRIGINLTMNLGRPAGKIFMGAIVLLVVGVLFATLIPVYMMDFNKEPFSAEFKNEELILKAPFAASSEIKLSDIQQVALVNELKKPIERTNGYGGENYSTGYYLVANKKATLYLDNRVRPFLKITTNKRDYYFTFKEEEKTKQLYQNLAGQLP